MAARSGSGKIRRCNKGPAVANAAGNGYPSPLIFLPLFAPEQRHRKRPAIVSSRFPAIHPVRPVWVELRRGVCIGETARARC